MPLSKPNKNFERKSLPEPMRDENEDGEVALPKAPKKLSDKIQKHILDVLGIPPNFFRIDVNTVSTKAYRVNVVTQFFKDSQIIPDVRRPHTYYVRVDEDNELSFSPELKKTY
jgi:hypothetical protein